MTVNSQKDVAVAFSTPLGWFAMIGSGQVLKHLAFGHRSIEAAMAAFDPTLFENAEFGDWNPTLVRRLQAYAAGARDDFRDVAIDPGPQTQFQRDVIRSCRQIGYGKTLTYGQLAAKAGHPQAARAVGQCMAANRIALVIPCHRVVSSSGRPGGYSAAGGVTTKRRLLYLERNGKLPVGAA